MSAQAKNRRRPRDLNKLAASIVADATDEDAKAERRRQKEAEAEKGEKPDKNPAAVALGRLGGQKGGKARAEALSAERRVAIARKAARARWSKRDDEA